MNQTKGKSEVTWYSSVAKVAFSNSGRQYQPVNHLTNPLEVIAAIVLDRGKVNLPSWCRLFSGHILKPAEGV